MAALVWLDDCAPLLFYLGSALVFRHIARIQGGLGLWVWSWRSFTGSAACLATARLLVIVEQIGTVAPTVPWGTLRMWLVILASVLMFLGACGVSAVYRIGVRQRS